MSGELQRWDDSPTHHSLTHRIGFSAGDTNLARYVWNSPTNYVDPSGLLPIDTIWDIGHIIYDVGRLGKNTVEMGYEGARYGYYRWQGDAAGQAAARKGLKQDLGEFGEAALDTTVDTGSLLLPYVPAGASKAARLADEAVDTAKSLDNAADTAKTCEKAADGASKASKSPSGFEPDGVNPLPGTRVRPEGIPEGWRIRPTRTKGGVEYYNPKNPNEHVRVMQGNPSSPYRNSQNPYVRQRDSSGSYLDPNGNRVPKKSPDGHIPLDQYPGFIK